MNRWSVAESIHILGHQPQMLVRCPSTLFKEISNTTINQVMDEQIKSSTQNELINLLLENGLSDGMQPVMQLLLNAAMLIERSTSPKKYG